MNPFCKRQLRVYQKCASCSHSQYQAIFSNSMPLGSINETQCSHSVLIFDMCAECGEVLSGENQDSFVSAGFLANESSLTVSKELAVELEKKEFTDLVDQQKLCLILDLDNTLLHASSVPPPNDAGGEVIQLSDRRILMSGSTSRQESCHPHYQATSDTEAQEKIKFLEKNVVCIPLNIDSQKPIITYYKLRPGVINFLSQVSELFEPYLYTMGVAEHAAAALLILDPGRRWFGDRVFSRKDVLKNGTKTLKRIFPYDSRMAIVLDDSEDVWPDAPAVIKVHGYYWFPEPRFMYFEPQLTNLTKFFAISKGFGQFCSSVMSFWRQFERKGPAQPTSETVKQCNTETTQQQLQPKRRRRNEASRDYKDYSLPPQPLHREDEDEQLCVFLDVLRKVHSTYFNNVSILDVEVDDLPNVADILCDIRKAVLQGVTLHSEDISYFSKTDFARWATEFGATLNEENPTHIVYQSCPSTIEGKHNVHVMWLESAIYKWRRDPESIYSTTQLNEKYRCFWNIRSNNENGGE